ncbi:flagellar hook-basal body complex protein FliE [Vibrio sp.]|nr:flagellar hook-basal body complex protein FliE [Vibrio sp.]
MISSNEISAVQSPLILAAKDNALMKNTLEQGNQAVDFSALMKQTVNSVNEVQHVAKDHVTAVELGQSDDVIGAVIATQKASLSFTALMQVRNKAVSGINDILRMPL